MVQKAKSVILFIGLILNPLTFLAQEDPNQVPELDIEQSADVFLEAYSDEFQENFFEALKQKGIENYDKAINFLLKCKQLDASKRVVDHELAKVYYESDQYTLAEEYALTAVTSEPDNLWYTDTLIQILEKQGKSPISMKAELPFGQEKFDQNMAQVYFEKGNYKTALAILKNAGQNRFTTELTSKINDSIDKRDARAASSTLTLQNTETKPNPLDVYMMRIAALMRAQTFVTLQEVSEEALEGYPSQPYFYYALGYALNKREKHPEAVEILETALDYLIDDVSLSNKIHQELADGYTAMGDAIKANTYLRKIKPGF